MADKVRQYGEHQKDIPQQSVQGTDRVTKDHEVQMEQLKQQHKRALEEKGRQLTECRSRLQEKTQRCEKDNYDEQKNTVSGKSIGCRPETQSPVG